MSKARSFPAAALGIAGALHACCFALFDTQWSWALSLLCVSGLAAAWFTAESMKTRMTFTLAFSLGWFVAGLYWLHITMHKYGGMHWILAATAVVLFAIYLSSFFVAAAALYSYCSKRKTSLAQAALFAACMTAADLARGYLFTGFPWIATGYAQIDSPLASLAPVIGVYGLSFVVYWMAAVLAWNLTLAKNARRSVTAKVVTVLTGLSLVACPLLAKVPWTEPGQNLSVALIQTNFEQAMKFDPQQIEGNMLRALALADAANAQLIVFPETVWPVAFEVTKPQMRDIFRSILSKPKEVGQSRAFVMGLPYIHSTGEPRMSNAVAVFDSPNQIDPTSAAFSPAYVYSKQHLVPFGEFIPLGFAWFVDMLGMPLGEFRRGGIDQGSFKINTTTVAFNICYEDLFGEEIAAQATKAQVLINVSNLGWFDRSLAIAQHLNIARMRALETQRPMLRATNTGATAVIEPNGKISAAAPYWQEQTVTAQIRGTTGLTPYVRWTNWPVVVLVCVLIGLIATWQRAKHL
jgi:apolipoprotein N-acyltransferase